MAANGFQLIDENISTSNILERLTSVASTQYNKNDALYLSASGAVGLASQVAATSKCTHVYVSMFTAVPNLRPATPNLSTTIGEQILAVPAAGNNLYFRSFLTISGSTPTINGTAANANSTANLVLVTFAGSTGDFTGGQVYIPSLQQQATILTDVVSGGVHTFTVYPAFSRAVTTGDTVVAVPWSKGATGVKFNASTPSQGVSTAVADKSGGNINIQQVVLGSILPTAAGVFTAGTNTQPYVVVSFPTIP